MFTLSLFEVILSILSRIYGDYIQFKPEYQKFLDSENYHKLLVIIEQLNFLIDYVSSLIVAYIPVEFLQNIRLGLKAYRFIGAIRFYLFWFPNLNLYRFPLVFILPLTEPIDFLFRILQRSHPQLPYVDVDGWIFFYCLDLITKFVEALIKMYN